MDPVQTAALAGTAATDMSMWSLFIEADAIVKAVMVALMAASFWCWAIIFDKWFRLRGLVRRADHFEESFWSGGSLEELYDRIGSRPLDPMSSIFVAAMREWRRSAAKGLADSETVRLSLPQRIDRVMQVTLGREMEQLESRMNFLASVGSTAPFIGLFGTVWGIMHAFQSIAAQKNTNLAIVAPSIAEALFTTAVGLIAAITAYIAYNKFSTDAARFSGRLEGFADDLATAVARRLAAPGSAPQDKG